MTSGAGTGFLREARCRLLFGIDRGKPLNAEVFLDIDFAAVVKCKSAR